jgi:hypothetical protein
MLANHLWTLGGVPHLPSGTLQLRLCRSMFGVNQLVSIGGQLLQVGGLMRYYAETPRGGPNWGFQFRMTLVFPNGS